MDKAVIASMARWPNVPDCYGWLHLDAQGCWRLGQVEPSGNDALLPDATHRVVHDGLNSFINRNYQAMPSGAWALQNGPQRVWVNLALAPLIVSIHCGVCTTHTGQVVAVQAVFASEDGTVYLRTDAGPAAVQSASMEAFSQGLLEDQSLEIEGGPTTIFWQPDQNHARLLVQVLQTQAVESTLGFKRFELAN